MLPAQCLGRGGTRLPCPRPRGRAARRRPRSSLRWLSRAVPLGSDVICVIGVAEDGRCLRKTDFPRCSCALSVSACGRRSGLTTGGAGAGGLLLPTRPFRHCLRCLMCRRWSSLFCSPVLHATAIAADAMIGTRHLARMAGLRPDGYVLTSGKYAFDTFGTSKVLVFTCRFKIAECQRTSCFRVRTSIKPHP